MALGFIRVVAGNMTYWVAVAEPDAPKLHEPNRVYPVLAPDQVMDTEATEALPVPVLVRVR